MMSVGASPDSVVNRIRMEFEASMHVFAGTNQASYALFLHRQVIYTLLT